jgi:hypothetical protein
MCSEEFIVSLKTQALCRDHRDPGLKSLPNETKDQVANSVLLEFIADRYS